MVDRMLVPLDGSAMAAAAIPFVLRFPVRFVRLLRVEPDFSVFDPERQAARTAHIRDDLAALADPLREQGVEVDLAVRSGDPAEEIIAAAADVDLIVMTTRGRGAAARALFGSTADRVVRYGTTPTLLLRVDADGAAPPAPTRIIVPLDGSPRAEQALPEAARLAETLRLPLLLVRVVDLDATLRRIGEQRPQSADSGADARYTEARIAAERDAADYLAQQAAPLRERGVAVTTEIIAGTPVFVLLDLAQPSDLIVMTSQGESGLRRWLIGSVAEKLVREAAAPVLLVHDNSAAPLS
ncbi:MAG: universal stress protein [Thermomicrobiales bacterium]|nr:universal stress protein [Thermomicrobiales bacterium]